MFPLKWRVILVCAAPWEFIHSVIPLAVLLLPDKLRVYEGTVAAIKQQVETLSRSNTHFSQRRTVDFYVTSGLKCATVPMGDRFSAVKREGWILLFIVNTGEAWNHTHRGACKSCSFNYSQNISMEVCLPLLHYFPAQHVFAHVETKLLIILICGLFVCPWSNSNCDWSHTTHFPLCNNNHC